MELKKSIVAYMELIDIMMLKMYDYKRKKSKCSYNLRNNSYLCTLNNVKVQAKETKKEVFTPTNVSLKG